MIAGAIFMVQFAIPHLNMPTVAGFSLILYACFNILFQN